MIMWGNILSLLGMLAAVAAILALAYWCTRLVGSFSVTGASRGKDAGGLQVLRQVSLGRNQRLLLVRAGERFLLLGVAYEAITLLTELSAEEAGNWQGERPEERAESLKTPGFMEILKERTMKRK